MLGFFRSSCNVINTDGISICNNLDSGFKRDYIKLELKLIRYYMKTLTCRTKNKPAGPLLATNPVFSGTTYFSVTCIRTSPIIIKMFDL